VQNRGSSRSIFLYYIRIYILRFSWFMEVPVGRLRVASCDVTKSVQSSERVRVVSHADVLLYIFTVSVSVMLSISPSLCTGTGTILLAQKGKCRFVYN